MANWGVGFGEFASGLAEGVPAGMKLGAQYQYTRRQRLAADQEEREQDYILERQAINKEQRKEALTPEEKQRVWAADARATGRVAKGGTDPLGLVESGGWLSGLGRAFKRLWSSVDTSDTPGAASGIQDPTAYMPQGYRALTPDERRSYGDYRRSDIYRADGGVIPEPDQHIKLPPDQEQVFQQWYGGWAKQAGIDPNPDNPAHKYDYRAAWRAGAKPSIDPNDGLYHWPSQFKDPDHPNRYVGGVDTRTGQPVQQEFGPRAIPEEVGEGVSRSAFGYSRQPTEPAPAAAAPPQPQPDPTQPSPQAKSIADRHIVAAGGKGTPPAPAPAPRDIYGPPSSLAPRPGSREQVPGGYYDPTMVYPNLTPGPRGGISGTPGTREGEQSTSGPYGRDPNTDVGRRPDLPPSISASPPGSNQTRIATERRGLPEPDASYPGHPGSTVTARQPGQDPNFPTTGSGETPGGRPRIGAPSDVTEPVPYRPDVRSSTYGTLLGDSDEPAGLPPGFRSPRGAPSASAPQGEQGTLRGDMTLSMPGVRQAYDPTDAPGSGGYNPGTPPGPPAIPVPRPPERDPVSPPPLKPIAVPPRGSKFYGTDPQTGDSLYIVPGFGSTPTPWPPIPGADAAPPGTPGAGPQNVPGGPIKPGAGAQPPAGGGGGGSRVVQFKPQGAPGAIRTPEDQSGDAKVIPFLARSQSPDGQQPKDFLAATRPPGSPDDVMPDPQRYTDFLRLAEGMMEINPERGMRMLGMLMDTQMKGLQHGLVRTQIAMEAGDFDTAQQMLMRTYNGFVSPATGDNAQFNIDKQGNITMQRYHQKDGKLVPVDKKPVAVTKEQLLRMGVISMGPGHLADYILKQQAQAETARHHGVIEKQGEERLQREDVRFGVQLTMDNNRLKLQIWEAERKERRDAAQAYRDSVRDFYDIYGKQTDIAEKLRKQGDDEFEKHFGIRPVSAKEQSEFLDKAGPLFEDMAKDPKKSGLFDIKTTGQTEPYSTVQKNAIVSLAADLYRYNTSMTPEQLIRYATDLLHNKDLTPLVQSGRPQYRLGYSSAEPLRPIVVPESLARQVAQGEGRRAIDAEKRKIEREVGKDTIETGGAGGKVGQLPSAPKTPQQIRDEKAAAADKERRKTAAEQATITEESRRSAETEKRIADVPRTELADIVAENQSDEWLRANARAIAKKYNVPEDWAYTRLLTERERWTMERTSRRPPQRRQQQ